MSCSPLDALMRKELDELVASMCNELARQQALRTGRATVA